MKEFKTQWCHQLYIPLSILYSIPLLGTPVLFLSSDNYYVRWTA